MPPFIEFMIPFSEAMVKLQLKGDEIFFPNLQDSIPIFIDNIFQFNKLFAMIFMLIVIIIPVFFLEELFLWLKLIMKKYAIVDLIYKIIVGIIFIRLMIQLLMLMEIKWSNVLLFICSLFLMMISLFESTPLNKQLIRNNKIILNLNERIINNELNMTKQS